jgi:hypothetical protein
LAFSVISFGLFFIDLARVAHTLRKIYYMPFIFVFLGGLVEPLGPTIFSLLSFLFLKVYQMQLLGVVQYGKIGG